MLKKPIVGGIVLLFLFTSLITMVSSDTPRTIMILYVDDILGSGLDNPPEDYTSIQDAIDNSNDGDTVYVYSGTYYENVKIDNWLLCIDSIVLNINDKKYWVICAGSINGDLYIWSGNIDDYTDKWIFENIKSKRISYESEKQNIYSKAVFDMQIPPGSARASSLAAIFTPSP